MPDPLQGHAGPCYDAPPYEEPRSGSELVDGPTKLLNDDEEVLENGRHGHKKVLFRVRMMFDRQSPAVISMSHQELYEVPRKTTSKGDNFCLGCDQLLRRFSAVNDIFDCD
jgi:hypothetical protein